MIQFKPSSLYLSMISVLFFNNAHADETSTLQIESGLPTITVVAQGQDNSSEKSQQYLFQQSQASQLNIKPQEIPQTINVMTQQQIKDFALSNIRDVLANTPGVSVSHFETDRTTYMARGLEISNVNKDGIGFPESSYNYHADNQDMFFYDRVEVVKGADALNNAFGDPSATINLIRKRPTADLHAQANFYAGSWDTLREEVDVSGSLHPRIRTRVMGYQHNAHSYLDRYELEKNGIATIAEADITDQTLLTVGYQQTQHKPNGNNWGANPLINQNGEQISYPRHYNYAPSWTYWDREKKNYFAELSHQFNHDWALQLHYEHEQTSSHSKLLYLSGVPEKNNTAGINLFPGQYYDEQKNQQVALNLTGKLNLLNREHEVALGYRWAEKSVDSFQQNGQYAQPITTDLASWTAIEPTWDTKNPAANYKQKFNATYLAGRWHLNDKIKFITGLNYVQAQSSGLSYGADQSYDVHKTSPYLGLTYQITPQYVTYASYLSIFRPQTGIDADTGKAAEPIKGESYELGLKSSWLNDRLMGTLAIFHTEEQNYPLRASDNNPTNRTIKVTNLRTQGIELGLNGQLSQDLNIALGYNYHHLKDLKNGIKARTYTPAKSFNLMTTYRIPQIPQLKLGLGLQWNDKTYLDVPASDKQVAGTIKQKNYTLVNVMANYELNPHIHLQFNVDNITNTKYLHEFPHQQGLYGASRNYMLGVQFKY